MKDLLHQNKYYYCTILIFLILGAGILFSYHKSEVSLWINNYYSVFFDKSFLFFNEMGEIRFSIVTVFFLLMFKDWRWALKAATCFVSVMVITQFMKHIIFPDSIRPILYFENGALRLVDGVVQLENNSFPSGHTSASFAIATFLALLKSGRSWNFIFALLAFLVAYGRIYMSQHFITDVYAGMIIGVLVTTLVWYYYPQKWQPSDY